jgi:copper resistance protein B
MKRSLIALLFITTATPALAQHSGHSMPMPSTQSQPAPANPHAGHTPPAQSQAADPHAGHQMPAPPPPVAADPHAGHQTAPAAAPVPAADPHAGHAMPAQTPQAAPANPHQGHDMGTMPQAADPHAGHQMGQMGADSPAPPVAPPPPEARSGPAHAADTVYNPAEMAVVREDLRQEHGDGRTYRFMIDQLEVAVQNGRNAYTWEDVQFWYGGDLNRLWIKSEGEGVFGQGVESAEVQALWSRAISPYWDLQAGIRYDFRPEPERGHLVLGVQGLAPYWFEIDAAAFLSEEGDVTARFEGEYDLRLTQRLILQPRAEVDFSLQNIPETRVGGGLSTAEAGLRLRYEIVPEFAPYVGVEYERAFGNTADFRRADGEDVGGLRLVLGVRTWF